MHVPTKARLAVAAVAASAVSMGVAAPSFAAATPARTAAPSAPTPVGAIKANLDIHPDPDSSNPLATDFVIHASDTAGAKLTYTLDFGDGSGSGGPVLGPDGMVTAHHTYKTAGTYQVALTIKDDQGNTGVSNVSYTAGAQSGPTALATVTTTPGSLAVSADLSKSAAGSGQTIALITLDWGDGSTTDLKNPTAKDLATPVAHTYKAAGSYTLKTTVTDADGIAEASTAPVVVTASATGGTAVSRIAGGDRYQTAIAISSKLPAGSAPAVVLATGGTFPDALAGVPLAKKVGGPLLLTPGTGPNAAVTAEIKRVLKPGGTVYVLGGTNAVPQSVVQALGAVNVDRIGGTDRYETALKIADQLGDPSHVVLATGEDYADALAAGPYAADIFGADASHPAAILLTADKQLTPDVKAYLAKAGGAVAAVGGQAVTAAQSAHVALALGASFRGYDRYFTAAMVAGAFKGETTAGVATGENFADALTGAASLARAGGPLVLTPTHLLAPATWAALQGIEAAVGATGTVEVFGGPAAVSGTTLQSVVTAVHGHLA
ncbi:cell wall-binding repeat-containing protein [Catenulispora sp. NF23]|uniref:Cell wall-binding repeat-containing protein n=1 Tax=Catenulispora pinistramenti TaxID=2705254 RepID=A0ABS5KNR7_9ACTN|nr:cell wall-binding repeat-containing protein [Catenulispora pinistramenti]MBS2537637.1 cell wall-binding repeat-containing protein [Catenulispora pinistramenti]MBS2547698.1 cell wall-binding repeat-containing protein [Catenulispora pinistramenti]